MEFFIDAGVEEVMIYLHIKYRMGKSDEEGK
jgi:hypothetical protein